MTPEIQNLQVDLDDKRVETGRVQFNEDWPGIFLRGDDAMIYAAALEWFLNGTDDIMTRAVIEGLLHTLQSCDVKKS